MNKNYGTCLKHPFESMLNCPLCALEKRKGGKEFLESIKQITENFGLSAHIIVGKEEEKPAANYWQTNKMYFGNIEHIINCAKLTLRSNKTHQHFLNDFIDTLENTQKEGFDLQKKTNLTTEACNFIIWIHTNMRDWTWNANKNKWTQDGWKSRTMQELFNKFIKEGEKA